MDIRYVYPNVNTLKAISKLSFVTNDFELSPIENIFSLVSRLHNDFGDQIFDAIPKVFRLKGGTDVPKGRLGDWLTWIENVYVPQEPTTLSPGAMSNAPDRFNGFHSFNRCCRSTADTGRSATNLKSYTTDRRVFEYWAAGDWIAADRLMGIIRRDFAMESCLNGHPGPCQADHIGPISLGFNHRPYFQMLCGACNSAKNNRMYLSDVAWLIEHEKQGEDVISWHSRKLWDICKSKIVEPEHSLRLSKLLRDNRHSYMHAVSAIAQNGHYAFLASLLELQHADWDVEFVDLKIVDHVTSWSKINHTRRETKYAAEQKSRRSRIAFGELLTYFSRQNRNAFVVETAASSSFLQLVLTGLSNLKEATHPFDEALRQAISADVIESDKYFRTAYSDHDKFDFIIFDDIKLLLGEHMNTIGGELGSMWENERFTRELKLELE